MRITRQLGFVAVVFAVAGCGAEGPTQDEPATQDERIAQDSIGSVQDERAAQDSIGVAQEALNGFSIKEIVGGGSGCPYSPVYTITTDGQTFTVYFENMMLQHPPGLTFQKVNCVVGVNMHLPHGYQLSIGTVNTRGYAHLPNGTYMDQRSTYSFAGGPKSLNPHSRIYGFYDDDWRFTDNFYISSVLKSPCGGDAILNIDTALILNTAGNNHTPTYVDNTTLDGTFRMIFQFGWDHCTP